MALAVVALLAISLVTTTLLTQRSARTARNNTQATNLAQQNIEQMRVFRDRMGFGALVNDNPTSCSILDTSADPNDPATWVISRSLPCVPETITLSKTLFGRSIKIDAGSNSNQKKLTVTVTWQDTGGLQTVTIVTYLSNCVSNPSGC